jgi:hypothetical protein
MFQTKKSGGIDKKSILQLILIMLLLQGCIETSVPPWRAAVRAVQPVSCPGLYEIKPALLVAVLVDRSGSVQDTNSGRPIQARTEEGLSLSRIKADIASLVGQLGSATLIVVRFISEQSYSWLVDSFLKEGR